MVQVFRPFDDINTQQKKNKLRVIYPNRPICKRNEIINRRGRKRCGRSYRQRSYERIQNAKCNIADCCPYPFFVVINRGEFKIHQDVLAVQSLSGNILLFVQIVFRLLQPGLLDFVLTQYRKLFFDFFKIFSSKEFEKHFI
jgi:hypothetical protein